MISESQNSPGAVALRESIEQALRTASPPAEVFFETLETARFPDIEHERTLVALLKSKYDDRPPRLVITITEPALDFWLRHRSELFPSAALLSGFLDERMLLGRPAVPRSFQVFVRAEPARTIRLAGQLRPGLRKVVVVGGASRFDRAWFDIVRADLEGLDLPLEVTYLPVLPLKSILGEIAVLGDDAVVLFVSLFEDGARVQMISADVMPILRRATAVPIFALADTYIGRGATGGVVIPFSAHARDLSQRALQILRGVPPGGLPPVTTATQTVLDARELSRFNIAEAALPPGAVVAFRPAGFWQVNGPAVLVTTGATLMLLLLGFLLVQGRRQRRSEAALAARQRLGALVEELLIAFATVPLHRIDVAIAAALKQVAEATGADEVRLWEPRPGEDRSWMPLSLQSGDSITLSGAGEYPRPLQDLEATGASSTSVVATPLRVNNDVAGVLFWISHAGPPAGNVSHELRAIAETFAQALQRKRADSAIEGRERLKNAVLSSLTSSIAVLDRDGVIIEVNEAWKRFGRENGLRDLASILPGVNYVEVCRRAAHDDVPGAVEALVAIESACQGRPQDGEIEYRFPAPDFERWFSLRASPLIRDEGGAVVIHREISQQKRAERVLHTMSGRLIAAQESERRRVARELHDNLGQRVALLGIEIEQTAQHATRDVAERIRWLGERTAEIAGEIHRLSHGLHSAKLDALGLVAAVRGHCREMSAAGFQVTFSDANVPFLLPPDVALSLFRVVQEALNNVVKHSGATQAEVSLTGDDYTLRVKIADAGHGFDVADAGENGGLGLLGMRERLSVLGGDLSVTSWPGGGTVIDARVPIMPVGRPESAYDAVD